jgi:tetratricopeptide (TPR) repeat protein
MRKSTTLLRGLLLAAALVLSGAGTLLAQYGQQQQQNPPTPPPTPGQPAAPAAPPVNKEEEDAYKKFFEFKGAPTEQIPLGEEFLKKFPESRYRESVYSRLTTDYLATNQEDKMFNAGEKTLEMNPDNVDVLALLAMVIPRRTNTTALDADQRLTKAENYGKKAIVLIPALPKPSTVTEEDFTKAKNEKLSMCHSGLGFIYYLRGKYLDSATELTESTKLTAAPDPADFFVLGAAYEQAKKLDDAVAAYGKCSEIPGPIQARCKQSQDAAKKKAAAQPKP